MKNENMIQVGGKSYIKSKVVALPTEKATSLYFDALTKKVLQNDLIELYKGDKAYFNFEPRHLYFLSDEKIKDEDLVLHKNRVHRVSKNRGLYLSVYEFTNIDIRTDFCKKIIAATDESIGDSLKALPRPSNEFLEAYCKANGKIEEVLVEVEARTDFKDSIDAIDGPAYKPKVAPDNTITIRKVEEDEAKISFDKYIEAQGKSSEYNRMYGHHYRTFIAGRESVKNIANADMKTETQPTAKHAEGELKSLDRTYNLIGSSPDERTWQTMVISEKETFCIAIGATGEESKANAARIVKCANNEWKIDMHDELLEALRDVLDKAHLNSFSKGVAFDRASKLVILASQK